MGTDPTTHRVQRKRGVALPPGAVYVGRPTKYGNPIRTSGDWIMWTAVAFGDKGDLAGRRRTAVALYRAWVTGQPFVVTRTESGATVTGAFEYENGDVVPIDQLVRGFAIMATTMFPAPTLPPVPDLAPLRGKDLACWCPTDDGLPCHADVLLELVG